MECVVDDDSPMADILQGEGQADQSTEEFTTASRVMDSSTEHFAPRKITSTSLHARVRQRLGQPLRIDVSGDASFSTFAKTCSDAIGSNIHAADNEQFLERFRYIIIASNLLSGQNVRQPPSLGASSGSDFGNESQALVQGSWTFEGAMSAIAVPASIAGLIRWTHGAQSILHSLLRLIITAAFMSVAYFTFISYSRRQRLQFLRQRALTHVSTLIINLQALEQSSSAALTMIKEVESVSRGYMLRSPQLPPISILEDSTPQASSRRCARLRRVLRQLYSECIPSAIENCQSLSHMAVPDDVEKYLDVYEIGNPDVQEAFSGASVSEVDDQESLSALRAMQWRIETLRKVLLCHLLALPATGTQADSVIWRNAVHVMDKLSFSASTWAEKLNEILREEENPITIPSPTTNRNTPERERSRLQLRKVNELSAELRAMQAKLHILRDDVQNVLDGKGNTSYVLPLFTAASDAIGQDLRSLSQTYDSWKASLAPPASRRHSRASSEMRSPISLGGLTSVDESCAMDGPHEALLALNGLSSLSGSTAGSDEEVFEAVALPRLRRVLTREEKIAKLQDEETRRASAREQRMQGVSMVKELETVMNMRMSKRMSTGRLPLSPRVTSL